MDGTSKIEPEKIRENLEGNGNPGWRSICTVHRELWRIIEGNPEAEELLIEAQTMAKRMDAAIRKYKEIGK